MTKSHKVNIKPLSVNEAWKGKRTRSDKYSKYREDLFVLLPREADIPSGVPLKVFFTFGFSSKGSDYDNPVKPAQDIISEAYGFNDNLIYLAVTKKMIVPKGQEFIEFRFEEIKDISEFILK